MSRPLLALTRDNLGALPEPCRNCSFWESVAGKEDSGPAAMVAKEAWLSATLLDWGSCGLVVMIDAVAAGFVTYAPAHLVPRLASFATAPIAPDAVALLSVRVADGYRNAGIGRLLIQGMAADLVRRGVRAVEAVAAEPGGPNCLIPAEFLLAVGFKTVRPHSHTPRLRLDLRSTVSWREEIVAATLGRLRLPRPVEAYRSVN